MLTHLVKSINWVDVALGILLIRIIFIGVKNGFAAEFLKFLGIVVAVFVSLHYYLWLAVWLSKKTGFSQAWLGFLVFLLLWLIVWLIFKFLGMGLSLLVRVEANSQGFDKYAGGVLAVGRGLLTVSLVMFTVLLANNGALARMTLHSFSYRIAGRAATGTYSFLYNHVTSKLFAGQKYNQAVAEVIRGRNKEAH